MDILRENLDQEFIANANRLYRGMDERDMRTARVSSLETSIGQEALRIFEITHIPVRKLPGGMLVVSSEVMPLDEDGQPLPLEKSGSIAGLEYGEGGSFLGMSAGQNRNRPPLLGKFAVWMNPDRYRTPKEHAGFYGSQLVVRGLQVIEELKP